MNPRGRPFRRTVLIVFGIHVGLLLLFGLPVAQCHKPPPLQPVEMIDLGSLRPGPGLPSPNSSPAPATPTQPASEIKNPKSEMPVAPKPAPIEEIKPTPTPAEPKIETPTPPEPKPEPVSTPKPEPLPQPEPKPIPAPKHQVKVSTAKRKVSVSTSPASTESKPTSTQSREPAGPSASDIKSRLASKIPGEAGGGGGDGAGNAGRPDGVADDFSWYRALIKQSDSVRLEKTPYSRWRKESIQRSKSKFLNPALSPSSESPDPRAIQPWIPRSNKPSDPLLASRNPFPLVLGLPITQ